MGILLSCLNLVKERFRKNICGLDDYTILNEIPDLSDCRKKHIGDTLEYACCFWTKHLVKVPANSTDIGEVQEAIDEFSTTYLLFWIEVLSLTGNLGVGVHALNDVKQWYTLVSYMLSINP